MEDGDDSEEKYETQGTDEQRDESDPIIFGGQVPRASTQVTGLTNLEQAKTLMTLSTSKVQTKPAGHSKPSPYVPDSNLFNFASPNRPESDLDIARNQTYKNVPINTQISTNDTNIKPIQSTPTFTRPTAARNHGNSIQQRYAQHLTLRGDNSTQILFGRFTHKSSCCLLICSAILSLLFCYVSIVFFPKFSAADCTAKCIYSSIPSTAIHDIMQNGMTVVAGCSNSFLMFSYRNESMQSVAYTFAELQELDASDVDYMYLGGTSVVSSMSSSTVSCWWDIHSDDVAVMNGYVYIDYEESVWEWSGSGWYLILSLIMAMLFVVIEWLFYSYNEIMIPRKDYRAYVMWYVIRIGWMSFMFAIVIAHSVMISGSGNDIIYMVGDFDYMWVEADCYIATGFVALFVLICLCCCCFQESDGFGSGNPFSHPEDFGFERYFLPQSRMDLLAINDFEQSLGTAMCTTMVFVIGYIICGFVPFIEFLNGGLSGYTYFPYIVAIWFLSIIAMTFQMCWFVRAKCCGDDEDKRRAQLHDAQIRRAGTVP